MDFTVPAKVKLENVGKEDVGFRYFRVNFVEVLAPEASVTITGASSDEVAYYKALEDADKGLKVTITRD